MRAVREFFRSLYHGASRRSRGFRVGMVIFDLAILVFFVVVTLIPGRLPAWVRHTELVIAGVILFDITVRFWIAPNRTRFVMRPTTLIDALIVTSLLVPFFVESLVFLRVLRAVGLLRSFRVLRDLRSQSRFFRKNEDLIQSAINLTVFIFVMASLVYILQSHVIGTEITNFIDALYFTVATLTTTGFGDITLKGDSGHLLAVVIMVFGVSLFLRLLQTIFRPTKVRFTCPDCGLSRHEPDASHCKHCGHVVFIRTDGD